MGIIFAFFLIRVSALRYVESQIYLPLNITPYMSIAKINME
jgi:hypothetical protein